MTRSVAATVFVSMSWWRSPNSFVTLTSSAYDINVAEGGLITAGGQRIYLALPRNHGRPDAFTRIENKMHPPMMVMVVRSGANGPGKASASLLVKSWVAETTVSGWAG